MPAPTDPYTAAAHATAAAAEINARFAPLYAALTHGLDDDNVAAFTSAVLKPTVGVVQPGSDTSLPTGGAKQDVAGASLSITPSVASKLFIAWTAWVRHPTASAGIIWTSLNVDGADTTFDSAGRYAQTQPPAGQYDLMHVGFDCIALTAAAHTIKLRAAFNGSSGAGTVFRQGTALAYLLLAA